MLNQKKYTCGICKTTPDQISHHKSHIETQKHKDKKELFELKLYKLSDEELMNKYKTTNINDICDKTETIIYSSIDNIKIDNVSNNYIQDIMEKYNCISNKDILKEEIHEIHNILRNSGAGYGMNALKVFSFFLGLKKIEEKGFIDVVGLKRPECEFSYLLSLANENKDNELANLIYKDVLDSINDSKVKDLLFHEIPKKIKANVFSILIKRINNITKIEEFGKVLLSGKIYEYFIGRDESAISELGAYFTDRHIVDYIYKKLDPSINDDGSVPSMIDMFGGSGGFTTGFINCLNEKYPKGINWETELKKISHFDMNEDVIKSAGLEFFCLTGVIPDMNKDLGYKNSFTDDFINEDNDTYKKYKYPITNPPYGGDNNKKTENQKRLEKIKKEIKRLLKLGEGDRNKLNTQLISIDGQLKKDESNKSKVCVSSCSARIQKFAKDNKLSGKDCKGNDNKEACSLMLMMDMVEQGGTVIGVLKEGLFFDDGYTNIRTHLIKNYNVREIIGIPQNSFENTETKTSIVIFDHIEEKTSEVKFYDLVVEKYKEDKFGIENDVIFIKENKGDISSVHETLLSVVSVEEILGNAKCSLTGKEYNKKELACGEEYKLVRLGDICDINKKYILEEEQKYNYVEIGDITNNMLMGHVEYNKNDLPNGASNKAEYGNILISTVRPKPSKILYIDKNFKNLDKFVFSHALVNIELKDKTISYYIYTMLYILAKDFEKDLSNGSSYPRFKPNILKEFQIPIPKSNEKIIEWIDKISAAHRDNNKTLYDQLIKELSEEAMPTNTNIQKLTEANINTIQNQNNTKATPSVNSIKSDISSSSSFTSIKEHCKSLGMKGLSKYKANDKDLLLKLLKEHNKE
jgi:type I restriction-modification system DNA methylase subunit